MLQPFNVPNAAAINKLKSRTMCSVPLASLVPSSHSLGDKSWAVLAMPPTLVILKADDIGSVDQPNSMGYPPLIMI
jgi:hypothetical protein